MEQVDLRLTVWKRVERKEVSDGPRLVVSGGANARGAAVEAGAVERRQTVPRSGHTAHIPDTLAAAAAAAAAAAGSTCVARERRHVTVASQQRPGTRHRVSTTNRCNIAISVSRISN